MIQLGVDGVDGVEGEGGNGAGNFEIESILMQRNSNLERETQTRSIQRKNQILLQKKYIVEDVGDVGGGGGGGVGEGGMKSKERKTK